MARLIFRMEAGMRLKDHAETSTPKTASIAHLEAILAENASAHDDDEIRAECGITFGMMRDAVTLAALKAVPHTLSSADDLVPSYAANISAKPASNSPWEALFSAIDGMGQWAPTAAVIELHRLAVAAALRQAAPEQPPTLFSLKEKAEEQIAYWRKRQESEKCLDDGVSEDGETYTPIGDRAAWQGGYCNGRMSEADWWLKTFRAMATASPPASGQQQASSCEGGLRAADRAAEIMHAISKCGPTSISNDRWCLGHKLITQALQFDPAGQSTGQPLCGYVECAALGKSSCEDCRDMPRRAGQSTGQGADGWTLSRAFDLGFSWAAGLYTSWQSMEDSRAVGRTLAGPQFDGLNLNLDGWNSFQSGDLGMCEGKRRIKEALDRAAALAARPAAPEARGAWRERAATEIDGIGQQWRLEGDANGQAYAKTLAAIIRAEAFDPPASSGQESAR
ncbi:hypothetical protein FHR71_005651 [Methylobacterium sp. RAS18]|nr:hypothetical protein [Methylobacterium sp. RAS18]